MKPKRSFLGLVAIMASLAVLASGALGIAPKTIAAEEKAASVGAGARGEVFDSYHEDGKDRLVDEPENGAFEEELEEEEHERSELYEEEDIEIHEEEIHELDMHHRHLEIEVGELEFSLGRLKVVNELVAIADNPTSAASFAIMHITEFMEPEDAIGFLAGIAEEASNPSVRRLTAIKLAELYAHAEQPEQAAQQLRKLILDAD